MNAHAARPWVPVAVAVGLFLIWSNSFVAMSYVLGGEQAPQQLDWVGLTVARFLPVGPVCALYCFVWRRAETLATVRQHWRRLLVCGFVAVPSYNFALYFAQQHGVPAPVASLTTTLVPLFVMLLAALFLGERLTSRRLLGFGIAATGMLLVSLAKNGERDRAYPLLVALAGIAPLSWSIYSVLSKPVTARVPPIVWTYLATATGTLLVLPFLPGPVWRQCAALDDAGWFAVLYLSFPCTVLGFVVWTWLLKHLPASTVGFTVFMNPPLTAASKQVLALLFPATFVFTIGPLEWVGGVVALTGMAVAIWRGSGVPRSGGGINVAPSSSAGHRAPAGETAPLGVAGRQGRAGRHRE